VLGGAEIEYFNTPVLFAAGMAANMAAVMSGQTELLREFIIKSKNNS
jgi:hypothetical protein